MSFGPLGEHRLLRDEAVPAVGGALMEQILCTLVPAARLVVVVGDLSVTLRPEGERKEREKDIISPRTSFNFFQVLFCNTYKLCMFPCDYSIPPFWSGTEEINTFCLNIM